MAACSFVETEGRSPYPSPVLLVFAFDGDRQVDQSSGQGPAGGEAGPSRPHGGGTRPGSTSVDVAGRAAATRRLQRMSSSCRCSPPSLAPPACSGRLSARIASRRPSAVVPPHYRDLSPGVPASVRREPSGCASPPSLRARLPMRARGSGLLRSRRLATSGPCACWLSRAVRGIRASSRR